MLFKKNTLTDSPHKQTSYRRTCSGPGVTVPGRITLVRLKAPSWAWKTGLSVTPEDCNRVFNTSRGQVMMAPIVPLHLQIDHKQKSEWWANRKGNAPPNTLTPLNCSSCSCKVTHISFDCGEGCFHCNTAESYEQ